VDADDAFEDAEGFLGGVAGFFFAGGGDDGVPPDVGWGFAAGGFFGADKTRGHVGYAVRGGEVKGVVGGMFGVPEDVVVLGGPAFSAACAVVICPDDLVLEAGSPRAAVQGEDFVEHDLAVVDLAGVDMEEERASRRQDTVGFGEARSKEAEEVVKGVGVAGCGGEFLGAVALPSEAGAVASGVADGLDAVALLRGAGVEGRVDVDELYAAGGHFAEGGQVVLLDDTVQAGLRKGVSIRAGFMRAEGVRIRLVKHLITGTAGDANVATELYFEDLYPGLKFNSGRSYKVTAEEIKQFAELYDPQPFHLDEAAGESSFFKGLAASGWLTAAIVMRLRVESIHIAGGMIGAGVEEIRWTQAVRPGDSLRTEAEILNVRKSATRPKYGVVRSKTTVFNQRGEVVMRSVVNFLAPIKTDATEAK
jgi:acyl dehydratase